jgi:hypothetical protein
MAREWFGGVHRCDQRSHHDSRNIIATVSAVRIGDEVDDLLLTVIPTSIRSRVNHPNPSVDTQSRREGSI